MNLRAHDVLVLLFYLSSRVSYFLPYVSRVLGIRALCIFLLSLFLQINKKKKKSPLLHAFLSFLLPFFFPKGLEVCLFIASKKEMKKVGSLNFFESLENR